MPEKDAIQTLVEEAARSGLPMDRLRGVAFYDMEKDAFVSSTLLHPAANFSSRSSVSGYRRTSRTSAAA
jgi:hypothetical protein